MKKERMLVQWTNKIKLVRNLAGLLLIPALLFVSCGDDDDPEPEPVVVSVSFPDAVNNPLESTIELVDTTFRFAVSADQNAEGIVEATIEVDLSLVSGFNFAHETSYLSMVDGSYELSGSKLTISNGASKSDSLSLTIKPEGKLEREKTYLLPVVIKSVSGNGTVSEQNSVNYFVITVNKAKEVIVSDIDRSNWGIECSSEELTAEGDGQGKAIYLLDNNIYTFWHSHYRDSTPGLPHWLLVDMEEVQSVIGFWLVDCQESWGDESWAKDMYFEVSNDKEEWTKVLEISDAPYVSEDRKGYMLENEVSCRYFRLTITNTALGGPHTYLGELGAYYNSNK